MRGRVGLGTKGGGWFKGQAEMKQKGKNVQNSFFQM